MKTKLTQIKKELIDLGIIQYSKDKPFTLSSGEKTNYILCEDEILSHHKLRNNIALELAKFVPAKTDLICGIATGSIPHAYLVANILELPFIYVNGNQIGGDYEIGQNVVLIEDVVSTGRSVLDARNCLVKAMLKVTDIVCIFYNRKLYKKHNLRIIKQKFHGLFNETNFIKQ